MFSSFANLSNICLTKRELLSHKLLHSAFLQYTILVEGLKIKILNIILFDIISQIDKWSFLKLGCKRNLKPDQWTPIILLPFIKFKLLNKKLGF